MIKMQTNQSNSSGHQDKHMKKQIDSKLPLNIIDLRCSNTWDTDLLYIPKVGVSNIEQVLLWNNRITCKGMQTLSRCKWENLIKIDVDKNQIGSKGMKYLSSMHSPVLKQLNLCSNQIEKEGVLHISKADWPKLQTFFLNGNKIGGKSIIYLTKNHWKDIKNLNLCTIEKIQTIPVQLFRKRKELSCAIGIYKASTLVRMSLSSCQPFEQQLIKKAKEYIEAQVQAQNLINQSQFFQIMKKYEISGNSPLFIEETLQRQQKSNNQKGKSVMIDTRRETQCVDSFPSNMVGFLRINLCDEDQKIIGGLYGTAILITPKILLTSAHNFFPPTDQYIVRKKDIEVSLAYHNHKGIECRIEDYKLSPFYSQKETKEEANEGKDFAIITLTNDIICKEIGQLKCVWDMNLLKEMIKDHDNIEIQMFGYPSDKNIEKLGQQKIKITQRNIIGFQFKSSGNLIAFDQNFLWHNMISETGQSGSPIFYANHLIGIHKGYNYQTKQYYGIPLWSTFMKPFIEEHLDNKI